MNKALQIMGICFLIILIPFIDIIAVPIMLGLMLIPGIMIPMLGCFALIAFLHYLVIKMVVDAVAKPDTTEKK